MELPDFQELVIMNTDMLKPYALALTRDLDKARDLCQETLYKALAYKEHYKPGTNIKAWMCTIMRNIFINDYRRNRTKKIVLKEIQYRQKWFENTSESSFRFKEIQEVIYNMPVIFKTSCILYMQGYKYDEIALALNQPLGTIKSRIHFAKKIMQKRLER
ncbi:MAG TPA: RNA polymerase sigma factor [Flavisolibacter sp.]|jgi:RNA polymerase sigma-70 factor (ECF subfamily)|nr:RNA polymerase sigma factor [Flavisolibacter sp.]